jgi:hypothetical protein
LHFPRLDIVKGVVYDILGREVRTLLNGEMNSGNHEVIMFDAKGINFRYLCFQASSRTKQQ